MMTLKTVLFGSLLVVASACATSDKTMTYEGMDPMAAMEAAMTFGTPGPAHADFANQVGAWNASMKMQMEPDAPPMTIPGTSTIRTAMGGRYLIENYRCDFMGQPFEGMLIQGYDNLAQEYWTIWIDSMSTGYTLSRGVKISENVIETHGSMHDAQTPDGRPTRSLIEHKDGTVIFTMFDTAPDGSEMQVMEIEYTR